MYNKPYRATKAFEDLTPRARIVRVLRHDLGERRKKGRFAQEDWWWSEEEAMKLADISLEELRDAVMGWADKKIKRAGSIRGSKAFFRKELILYHKPMGRIYWNGV